MLPRRFLIRCTHHCQQTSIHNSTTINKPTQSPLLLITRSKRTASSSNQTEKRAAISRAISNNNNNNHNTNQPSASASANTPIADNIFGMRPIDYTILPPIHRSPPPPPPRPGMKKYIFPLSVVFTAGVVGYFYVNNQNDNLEFWRAMQEGRATLDFVAEEEDEDEEEEEDRDVMMLLNERVL
ncbi:hypothetical protein HJC23_010624 [Cyclotella cryptica]|uniref:Transmembrane protein n=1 Tax=Cyclotella cryptica TaxID=29204 RepID=A0ABD3NKE5_9STRA|eukprot:CCRYP_020662-RA/>CCRYP_020662-RA protein AED:0.00 eAED:0.00 QI:195/-1/1/1/-1/1/1/393/182